MGRNATSWRSGGAALLLPDPARRVPRCPHELTKAESVVWRSLWRGGLGALWQAEDVPAVARVLLLRRTLADQPGNASLHAQLLQLESKLGLNPAGRLVLGVQLGDDPWVGRPQPLPVPSRRRDPRLDDR